MSTATGTINLQKGAKVDLTKTNPSTKKFGIGLGWDTNATSTGKDFDLDASVFVLGADGKRLSDSHFVYYNNLKTPNGAVEHLGDNRTGVGDGDDEVINVTPSLLEAEAEKVTVVVTIHEAAEKGQNFGQVNNAFIRVFDAETKAEILKFDLGEDYSTETAVTFGGIYKKDGEWKFEAVGAGHVGGLQKYLELY